MPESDHRESASRVMRNRLIGILVTALAWILFLPGGEEALLILVGLTVLGLFLFWRVLNRFNKTLARIFGAISLLLVVSFISMVVMISRQESRLRSHVGNSKSIHYYLDYLPFPRIISLEIDSNVDDEELARIFQLEDLRSVKKNIHFQRSYHRRMHRSAGEGFAAKRIINDSWQSLIVKG